MFVIVETAGLAFFAEVRGLLLFIVFVASIVMGRVLGIYMWELKEAERTAWTPWIPRRKQPNDRPDV